MKNIELNHLKYFYYTVLEGGVAQAADRLHVQQPVVSKMLKLLDEQFGQPLFWKKGRSKVLTNYGQLVFRHCQVVFDEINKMKQVATSPEQITGAFDVGASEPIVNYLFADKFSRLAEMFPALNFNIYTTTQSHLLNLISDGRLEMGCLFYASTIPSDLEVIKTIPFPFRLVIKKSLVKERTIIESFIGSREIDDSSTHSFPTVDFVRKKYPKTRITISSNSISMHKQLVLEGRGISIMPEFAVKDELKKGLLVDVFPKKTFTWDLLIIKRKSSHLTVPGQAFVHSW